MPFGEQTTNFDASGSESNPVFNVVCDALDGNP